MALGNFEMGIRAFPTALKDAPGIGYTVADVVAPKFVVALALTVGPSVRRRAEERGTAAALQHLATQALALILAVFTLPAADWWHAGASVGLGLSQAALIAAANIGLATYLDRHGWIVKL
jgi:hypothetical protein